MRGSPRQAERRPSVAPPAHPPGCPGRPSPSPAPGTPRATPAPCAHCGLHSLSRVSWSPCGQPCPGPRQCVTWLPAVAAVGVFTPWKLVPATDPSFFGPVTGYSSLTDTGPVPSVKPPAGASERGVCLSPGRLTGPYAGRRLGGAPPNPGASSGLQGSPSNHRRPMHTGPAPRCPQPPPLGSPWSPARPWPSFRDPAGATPSRKSPLPPDGAQHPPPVGRGPRWPPIPTPDWTRLREVTRQKGGKSELLFEQNRGFSSAEL